jgi:hypothetical protein
MGVQLNASGTRRVDRFQIHRPYLGREASFEGYAMKQPRVPSLSQTGTPPPKFRTVPETIVDYSSARHMLLANTCCPRESPAYTTSGAIYRQPSNDAKFTNGLSVLKSMIAISIHCLCITKDSFVAQVVCVLVSELLGCMFNLCCRRLLYL